MTTSGDVQSFIMKHQKQLKKYAEDLAKVYKLEQKKRIELEAANFQLKRFAEDLGQVYEGLKQAHVELERS